MWYAMNVVINFLLKEDEQQGDTYRNSFQGILHGPEDDSSKLAYFNYYDVILNN